MKRYQAIFIATVVATVFYYNYSIKDTVEEIQETIESTNEIVTEIQITLESTPYGLTNDYHCLASNIYWVNSGTVKALYYWDPLEVSGAKPTMKK